MVKLLLGFIIALLIGGVVFGAYYYGFVKQNKTASVPVFSTKTSPTPLPVATPAPQPIIEDIPITPKERPTAGFVNPSGTIAAIEEAFGKPQKDLSGDLGAWMTDKVSVTVEASECCGLIERKEASKQVDYLKTGKNPWDCKDSNPVAAKLRTKNPAVFKDAVICTSSDGFLGAFTLDDQFLITKIYMAASYKLILGN